MNPNLYLVEQLSRQVVRERVDEARQAQRARLAAAVQREMLRLRQRRNQQLRPAPAA